MRSDADANWADGIAAPLREMLDSGASDDDLDRFLCARRDGDEELAQMLHSEPQRPALSAVQASSASYVEMSLTRIRVAAIKPVVNQLPVQDLVLYIRFVNCASELLVEAHACSAVWESQSVVEAAAGSLQQAALEWLKAR